MKTNKTTFDNNIEAGDTTAQLADKALRQDLRGIIIRQDLCKFNTPAELKFEIEKQYKFSPETFDVIDEIIGENDF